jgi:DNA-binding MarR family transcriptional regulator
MMIVGASILAENAATDVPWLDDDELAAWTRLVAVVELLPGVLDSQLRRDAELTGYEYYVLAMLSEAPHHTLRMTALAARTNATLPRLSHVVQRLEGRGLVERFRCPQDGRATNARLTPKGWRKVRDTAPGHVANVREHVLDALTPGQVAELTAITGAILQRLDPDGTMAALYRRPGRAPDQAPGTSEDDRGLSGQGCRAGRQG